MNSRTLTDCWYKISVWSRALLSKDVSKASITKILDVSRSVLYHFIETRKIAPG